MKDFVRLCHSVIVFIGCNLNEENKKFVCLYSIDDRMTELWFNLSVSESGGEVPHTVTKGVSYKNKHGL